MSVAGGIGMRDLAQEDSWTGVGKQWTIKNAAHYNVSYPVYQPDMFVGRASWHEMLSEFPSIKYYDNEPILETNGVEKQGNQILSIKTGSINSFTTWNAKIFIDASYTGDLARFSNISYTYGQI